jgi:hypothetical protein
MAVLAPSSVSIPIWPLAAISGLFTVPLLPALLHFAAGNFDRGIRKIAPLGSETYCAVISRKSHR